MRSPKKRVPPPPVVPASSLRLKTVLAAVALTVVTWLAYSNSFSGGFVLDNEGILLNDPRIREVTPENLGLILNEEYWWPHGHAGLYRPLTTLTYLVNYAVLGNGDQPAGYHWFNFLLHAGNVLLLYALARRLLGGFWPPVFVSAIWAVHPVLTESVTNMVGRADLLSGMALLGGLLIYLRSAESRGWRQWAWLTGLLLVSAAGMFSKESAVVIAGLILAYELTWRKKRSSVRTALLGCLATLPGLALMLYQRALVISGPAAAVFPYVDNPLVDAGFWRARLTAIQIMGRYLGLLVWPVHLSADYSYAQIPMATGTLADWLSWTAVAAIGILSILMFRGNRVAFFAAWFAFLTFLPTANLLFPIGAIMAERFLYLPAISLAFCLVVGLFAAAQRVGLKSAAPAALCLVTLAFAARTWIRNEDWRDNFSLATATAAASPRSFKGHQMLARVLYISDPSHANIDLVIAEEEKALAILQPLPDLRSSAETYRRAAEYYRVKGDSLPSGEPAYRRSLDLQLRAKAILREQGQESAAVEREISSIYLRLHELREAVEAASEALRLEPLNADSYGQLSLALRLSGRGEDAAITLMSGVLVSGDARLRKELLQLYQDGLDTEGCATRVIEGAGATLNPACPIVRRHLCAASVETIRLQLRLKNRDAANQMKLSALHEFGCPAPPLDALLP